ncbi:uncharacterized protein LOC133557236 isoform X2 [Nerophis ophidion]|nr:uncharacterized protein LOC133557236 isoform X2 [Nerophis ophidion]XP_061763535.1 uncharacterized protein LOC133557236 isoform X2 [Nerophis ophidion]
MKLKQPITPTFQKSRGGVDLHQDEGRSHRKTWRTHDQGSPVIKQVPDKRSCESEKPRIWHALRRSWNSNRSSEPPHSRKEPPERSPQAKSEFKLFVPLRRASSGHPVMPPAQPPRRNSLQPSHIQTSSAATTLVPRNKVGFSSITISSRKVVRSSSLTTYDRQSSPGEPMDQTSVGFQRKPTIVKVVEQRTTLSPRPASADTVVHRRKAAIIKVTEHKGSYSPAKQPEDADASRSQGRHLETNPEVLRLLVPPPSELPGQKPKRPLSCHGDVFPLGDKPSEESVPPPAVRKWSLGLPQEAGQRNPANWNPLGPAKGAGDGRKLRKDEWRRSSPCLTLIQTPEPHQSPEDVLALNAAAIIANIKLQRQLSQKKTSHRNLEGESAASLQGNPDGGEHEKKNPVDGGHDVGRDTLPVPPSPDLPTPLETISLQEALRRSRPHFITRSQERVQQLGRKAQERRQRSRTAGPQTHAPRRQRGAQKAWSTNGHLSKPTEGVSAAASGKAKELRTNRLLTEVKKKKEEEKKKKEACLTNRQRVELFKKKLLDQILHRSSS